MANYRANGELIELVSLNGEVEVAASCQQAEKAADLLNKCGYLNDVKRKYTAAARAMHQAMELPGFRWLNGFAGNDS